MNRQSILVVDDNPDNLRLTEILLTAEGFDVLLAEDAAQTLHLLTVHHPDLILMDVQLPGIDGLELTRRLRQNVDLSNLLIVALTAYAMKGDEQKALSAGCDGYISKPIDTRKFPDQVRAYLCKAPVA